MTHDLPNTPASELHDRINQILEDCIKFTDYRYWTRKSIQVDRERLTLQLNRSLISELLKVGIEVDGSSVESNEIEIHDPSDSSSFKINTFEALNSKIEAREKIIAPAKDIMHQLILDIIENKFTFENYKKVGMSLDMATSSNFSLEELDGYYEQERERFEMYLSTYVKEKTVGHSCKWLAKILAGTLVSKGYFACMRVHDLSDVYYVAVKIDDEWFQLNPWKHMLNQPGMKLK